VWSLVLIGVLAGATTGVALAALDGARRTGTVIERASNATKEPDVLIAPDRPDFDWAPIVKLPDIEAIALFGGPVCALDIANGVLCGEVISRSGGHTIETGNIEAGRLPNADRADEVAVNHSAAIHYHLAVGDTFTMVSPAPAQIREAFRTFRFPTTDEFTGPKVKVHVVGIAAPALSDRLLGDPESVDSAEFYATEAYAKLQPGVFPGAWVVNAMARLKPGTNVAAFRRHVGKATGDPTIPVRDLAQDKARYDRTLLVERTALALLALVLLLVGAALVGQALTRMVKTAAVDVDTLVVLGASRGTAVGVVATPFVITVAAAIASAVVVTAVASIRFPIGTARVLEPDIGVHLDPQILGLGLVVLVVAIVACVGFAARAAVHRPEPRLGRAGGGTRAPLPLPLPMDLGVRLAVAPGRSGGRARSGSAIVGAVVGVLGIVGAMTFRAGIDDVTSHAARAGTTWNRVVNVPLDVEIPSLTGVDGVRDAAEVTRGEVEVGGQTMSAWSYDSKAGEVKRVLTSGRLPSGPDEATLGWSTARSLGVEVGDRVRASNGAKFRVVGIGLLPEQPGHSPYDRGLWVTPKGLQRFGEIDTGDRELLVDLDTHRGAAALIATLQKAIGGPVKVEPAVLPAGARDMSSVRRLPVALALFLAILAAGVSIHALANTVQRRRRDLAVLRALGFTPGQVRGIVVSQATTIGIIGVVVGVPLGLVVGRTGWRWVARSVPFLYRAPFAAVAVIAVIPAALAIVNVLAAVPARTAGRVRTAEVLRAQ
jgi:ABC-type lipoprotein release transport system permease subunit